jgi:hypothetical protein
LVGQTPEDRRTAGVPNLDDTLGLLGKANQLLADSPKLEGEHASALALVAVGMNLERIADSLEALEESAVALRLINENWRPW